MHFFIGPFLAIAFVGWVAYHGLIKKDLSKHRNDLYVGLIFLAIYAALYFSLIVYAS